MTTSSNSKQKYRRSKIKKITVKKCIARYLQGICTDSKWTSPRTSSNVAASDACLILEVTQSSTSQGSAQLIRLQPDTLYPAKSYLPAVTLLLPKTDIFPKEVFTHLVHQYMVCTGRRVSSDWKFIYYTKHKIASVRHVNRVCQKRSEIFLH